MTDSLGMVGKSDVSWIVLVIGIDGFLGWGRCAVYDISSIAVDVYGARLYHPRSDL